jgi:hypothetical protein
VRVFSGFRRKVAVPLAVMTSLLPTYGTAPIVAGTAVAAGAVATQGCGGSDGASPTQPGIPVTMSITFINSYTGQPVGTKTIAANAGEAVSISLADATGTGLDKNFGALREPGMPVGPRVAATSTGTITTTAKAGSYELFVHSSLASDMYSCGINGNMIHNRNSVVRKLSPGESFPLGGVIILEGPADGDQIMQEGLAMITAGLDAGGRQYGSLTWNRSASSADLAGGFATQVGGGGYNQGNKFVVTYTPAIVRGAIVDAVIEEAGEQYFGLADARGVKMVNVTCPGGMGSCAQSSTISEKGKAWFRAIATQTPLLDL